ncbi:MAG: glucosamine-6-phosphate deaminase [Rubrimonas sp.]
MLILPDALSAARRAADIVAAVVAVKPHAVLGLATGETMRPFYAELVARAQAGRLDLSRATTFNLDEYVGVAPDHPASFHAFMRAALLDHVVVAAAHIPRGDAPDPEAEAARYDAAIDAAGGVDLQVLGIGRNGHLAFNEPTSSLGSRTRVKRLAEATRRANAAAFAPEPAPRRAITMGVANILEARACVLLATGAPKAEAVAAAVEGPLGAHCPASALQLHRATTVILDQAAAGRLRLADYYETVHPEGGGAVADGRADGTAPED